MPPTGQLRRSSPPARKNMRKLTVINRKSAWSYVASIRTGRDEKGRFLPKSVRETARFRIVSARIARFSSLTRAMEALVQLSVRADVVELDGRDPVWAKLPISPKFVPLEGRASPEAQLAVAACDLAWTSSGLGYQDQVMQIDHQSLEGVVC